MAEYVEQRMEEMIPEIEELERVGLLSGRETKELVKKRKHFEYKIQKRTKQKEDFLGYIQYESNLLTLLEIRREEIGYPHKKGQIETAIRNRINRLYKILCHRWQADVKVWLSHVDWLTKMGWKSSVSKINLRLLQVHSGNAKLWISAAKYEFENGESENGRQIMLRGLRFLPKSKELHREYIKFELLFVEKLRARKKVLAIAREDIENMEKNNEEEERVEDEESEDGGDKDSDGDDEKAEKAAGKKKKSMRELDDEISDKVLNCDLVNLVLESAMAAVPEPEFLVSLLITVKQFPFAKSVQDTILGQLRSKFETHPVTVDTLARLHLEKDGKMKCRISECAKVYTDALELNPSAHLFRLAFSTLKDLPSVAPNCSAFLLNQMMKLLKFGQEKDLLSPPEFEFWLSLINVDDNRDETLALLNTALSKFPDHLQFWLLKLAFDAPTADNASLQKTMEAARSSLTAAADREQLWSSFMQIMNRAGKSEEAYKFLESATEKENCGELRVLLLERTREKGIKPCRSLYNRYHLLPPFSEPFHKTMLEIELEQTKVDKKQVRTVYSALCSQFGATCLEAWMNWIQWEEEHGSVLEVPRIVCRAEAELNPTLRNKFTTLREINKLS